MNPLHLKHRADGAIEVRPVVELGPFPVAITERLRHWAAAAPDRCFIARRDGGGEWRSINYADMFQQVRQVAAWLVPLELSADRPVAILTGNSLEHATLALACMYVGVPYCPVSTAYSTASSDHARLKFVLGLLTPGLIAVFADGDRERQRFDQALVSAAGPSANIMHQLPTAAAGAAALAAADAANARVTGDTIAKFLLTSGSTGNPKAVITTQRMLCSNQQMLLQTFPFNATEPPVLVDWLPWNHVFGGSHNFGIALYNGGSLYIDDGRPVPGAMQQTVSNLREISPTFYFNVPKGFEALVHFLERDAALCESFFRRLQRMMFAGAMLSQPVMDRLDALSMATLGRRIPMISGLGATETGPSVTFTTPDISGSGRIGLPAPGNLLLLRPTGGKHELRVKGPHVTPGYWRLPELTRAAFDAEGYYGLGDAVKFVDIRQPQLGLLFDGRITEDFKLATGTWVSVGPLRASLLTALSPLVQEVVIAGLNRDYLAGLLILDVQACRASFPELPAAAPLTALARHPALRAELAARLSAHATANAGSSTHLARALVLEAAPSLDAGEITDKGSINQRAVLQTQAALVEQLYKSASDAAVLVIAAAKAP
jgi:feruloyl-CoA synthase